MLALASQKGGVLKSSLARTLAVEAERSGLNTLCADCDPGQGSTSEWHRRRTNAGLEPRPSVELFASFRDAVQKARRTADLDLLVIDGPAQADRATLDLGRACDLVVLPTGETLDDLNPAVRTANSLVKGGVAAGRILFVLTKITGEKPAASARAYLERAQHAYGVASGYIPFKSSFGEAMDQGRSLTEVRFPTLRDAATEVVGSIVDTAVEAGSVAPEQQEQSA